MRMQVEACWDGSICLCLMLQSGSGEPWSWTRRQTTKGRSEQEVFFHTFEAPRYTSISRRHWYPQRNVTQERRSGPLQLPATPFWFRQGTCPLSTQMAQCRIPRSFRLPRLKAALPVFSCNLVIRFAFVPLPPSHATAVLRLVVISSLLRRVLH